MKKAPNQWIAVVVLIVILVIVFGLWRGAWLWIDHNITAATGQDASNAAVQGQFGDKFGAVNALFSGLAFAGIIFTIFLQRGDLRETQRAMSQERFDTTFFQLLNVHIAITERISVGAGGHTGRQAFERFFESLKFSDQDFPVFSALQKLSRDQVQTIKNTSQVDGKTYPTLNPADVANIEQCLQKNNGAVITNYLYDTAEAQVNKIVDAYVKTATQYIDDFSHYFRNLYHILKFIDESELITGEEKVRYSRFVRSQLSQVELVTLFYNSIAKIDLPGKEGMELGCPKMGRLLVRFDMLQNMNLKNIFHSTHKEIFDNNNGGSHAN